MCHFNSECRDFSWLHEVALPLSQVKSLVKTINVRKNLRETSLETSAVHNLSKQQLGIPP